MEVRHALPVPALGSRPRDRRSRGRRGGCIGRLYACGPAADLPQDYRVTLTSTPGVAVDLRGLGPDDLALVQRYCELPGFPPAVGVPFPCTDLPITVSDAAQTVAGTARSISSTRTGTFSLSCDFVLGATTSVRVALGEDFRPKPQDISLTALSGSGPIDSHPRQPAPRPVRSRWPTTPPTAPRASP